MISYFDLHCDTLSAAGGECALWGGKFAVDLERAPSLSAQSYALYTENACIPAEGARQVREMLARFERESERLSGRAVRCRTFKDLARAREQKLPALILALENARPLEADPLLFDRLCDAGLWMMTLTHNGGNAFAEGTYGDRSRGLSTAGRMLVKLAGERGVALDLSHLNERGALELLSLTEGPVLASHANCRVLCPDERNLSDEVIGEIAARGGIIGVTLHRPFVGLRGGIDDLLRHVEHLLEWVGEEAVAVGTDFDGTDTLIDGIENNADLEKIADRMSLFGYNERLIANIFYKNAYSFFRRWREKSEI